MTAFVSTAAHTTADTTSQLLTPVALQHLHAPCSSSSTTYGLFVLQDTRPGVQACAASASADPRNQMPVARSTLLLQKLPEQQLSVLDPRWQDDVLRYGQKIRLLAHPAAQVGVRGFANSTPQRR